MDHLSRDIDVIRPNIVKHPLTQEVKECEGIVPIPLEEKLYSTKKRKWEDPPDFSFILHSLLITLEYNLQAWTLYKSGLQVPFDFPKVFLALDPVAVRGWGMACLEPVCNLWYQHIILDSSLV